MTRTRLFQSPVRSLRFAAIKDRLLRSLPRLGALLGAVALLIAIVQILVALVTVTGDPRQLRLLAGGTLIAATAFARYVHPRVAIGIGLAALIFGLVGYLFAAGLGFQPWGILADSINFLTGMSVLQIEETTIWSLSVTPAPLFLLWYFALRGQYSVAAVVGAATVGFFVLTGDATPTLTLLGVVGIVLMLGFGDLDGGSDENSLRAVEPLALLLAVMILLPFLVSIVPSGAATVPLNAGTGGSAGPNVDSAADERTMSAAVVEAGDELDILGPIALSTDVFFTVQADEGLYWRTASYDRYTGDGWIKATEYSDNDRFGPAEGSTVQINQTFRAETELNTMPAAWRPFDIQSDSIDRSELETGAALQPDQPLSEGETYHVLSSAPDPSPDALRAAGTEYPDGVEEAYTQLPSDVPDRVHEATDTLVSDAENPYEAAVTIEQSLQANKNYSLDVERPEGDIADAFLFEMEAGYCTYFATTMVTMLRTQGIPARMAVGYTPGQQIDENTWVVRGTNAHAWVEVYFSDHGWIQFDPTPSDELLERQISELETTRALAEEFDDQAFDTRQSWDVPAEGISSSEEESPEEDDETEEEGENDSPETADNASDNESTQPFTPEDIDETGETTSEDETALALPSTEQLALIAVVAIGLTAGLRRSTYVRRLFKRQRLRWQIRVDAKTDIERSFERMLSWLEIRYRPRQRGETAREYLDAIDPDPRAHRVQIIREHARYREEITEPMADEAVRLVNELVRTSRDE